MRAISLDKQSATALGNQNVLITEGGDPEYNCGIGTRLIGARVNRTFLKRVRYTVARIAPTIVLQDDLTQESFSTNPAQVAIQTLLAWAMVYNKANGDTLKRACLSS